MGSSVGAPLRRQEVETLVGRTAEGALPGNVPDDVPDAYYYSVTYRWRGVFRIYVLRAKYLRLWVNMRDRAALPPEGEGGLDTLYRISNVVE
jgi:hypothetical protein